MALSDHQKSLGLNKISRVNPVEVHAARKATSIELYIMNAGFLAPVDRCGDLLAEDVEN